MNKYKINICMFFATALTFCSDFVANIKLVDTSGKEIGKAKCQKNADLKARLAHIWGIKNSLSISLTLNGREINSSDDIQPDDLVNGTTTVVVRIKDNAEVIEEFLSQTVEGRYNTKEAIKKIETVEHFNLTSPSHKNPDNDKCLFGIRLMLKECQNLEKRRELIVRLEPVFRRMIRIDHESMYHTWFADKKPVYKNYVFEEIKDGDKTLCIAYVDIEFTLQDDFKLRICRTVYEFGYNMAPRGKNDEEVIPQLGPVNLVGLEDAICYSGAIQIYKKDKLVVMFSYLDLSRSARLKFFLEYLESIFSNPSEFFKDIFTENNTENTENKPK